MKKKYKDDGTFDFTVKRLNLKHEPKAVTTCQGGTFNEIGEAIVKLRQSFLPKKSDETDR